MRALSGLAALLALAPAAAAQPRPPSAVSALPALPAGAPAALTGAARDAAATGRMRVRRLEGRADMRKFQDWTRRHFRPWLAARTQAQRRVEAAVQPGSSPLERAIATAIVGATRRDFARAIEEMPMPREIAGDAELLNLYRSALESATSPLNEQARSAFVACETAAAQAGPAAEAWARYCSEQRAALPPPPLSPGR